MAAQVCARGNCWSKSGQPCQRQLLAFGLCARSMLHPLPGPVCPWSTLSLPFPCPDPLLAKFLNLQWGPTHLPTLFPSGLPSAFSLALTYIPFPSFSFSKWYAHSRPATLYLSSLWHGMAWHGRKEVTEWHSRSASWLVVTSREKKRDWGHSPAPRPPRWEDGSHVSGWVLR